MKGHLNDRNQNPAQKAQKNPGNIVFPNKKEIQVSKETKEKAEIAKMYIQEKYQKLLEDEKKKKEYWDKLVSKMKDMNLSANEQQMYYHMIKSTA